MSSVPLPAIDSSVRSESSHAPDWDAWINCFARIALAAAFLSGIASRFGWWGKDVGYGNFDNFMGYTAEVNSFMPASTVPFLAWSATAAELFLGVALILGIWRRWVAWGSALLLMLFGTAMAISFGIKNPLDYSVFSAAAAALLLAQAEKKSGRKKMSQELKAFITSLVNHTSHDAKDLARPAHGMVQRIARRATESFAYIGDAVEDIGPYTCELRPIAKANIASAEHSGPKDAIGHHGLA
jgi:putative oxidoreductase